MIHKGPGISQLISKALSFTLLNPSNYQKLSICSNKICEL
jgi:hypothetical protein